MLVAGIMSGTSADSIDTAVVAISGSGWEMRCRLVAFHSMQYPSAVRQRLLTVAAGDAVPAGEIARLNFLVGELFARACLTACQRSGILPSRLQLIGSHGQTIFHQGNAKPFCGEQVRATLQIGEPAVIAARTGVTTVADFRPADMAAGGQGAPLVPFFDYLLYRHPRRGRLVLNIGGIANLTAIPAGGSPEQVIAFDSGPGNMLLDALAAKATGGRLRFDAGGRMAAQGAVEERLLQRVLRQRYFRLAPPKSAGREQFGDDYVKKYFSSLLAHPGRLPDALATAAALTAESIARAVEDFVLPKLAVHECIVSGGGVQNRFLMAQLQQRLSRRAAIRLLNSEMLGVPAKAKEAMAFAVLAYQSWRGEAGNIPSATGAAQPVILGKVIYARRQKQRLARP